MVKEQKPSGPSLLCMTCFTRQVHLAVMRVFVARGTAFLGKPDKASFRRYGTLILRSVTIYTFEAGMFAMQREWRAGAMRVDQQAIPPLF